jgi:hypothetical protein
MKKVLFAAALLAAASSVQAQVTVGTPIVINTGSAVSAGQDVDFYNNALYITSFSNQDLVRVSDITSTPTLTQVLDFTPLTTWGASRGLQDLDIIGNIAYVYGDNGTNGLIWSVDLSAGTPAATVVASGQRLSSGELITGTQFYAGRPASSQVISFDDAAVTADSTSALPDVGWRAPIRDVVTVGTSVFYVSAATDNIITHKIGQFTPVATAGDFTGSAFVQFFDGGQDARGSRNHLGIDTYVQGATTYLVFPRSNAVDGNVVFVDASNAANTVVVGATELATEVLTSANVGVINGVTYLAVTSTAGGLNPNELYLFPITSAASSVESWNQY